jgi:serine/threonine protein kinase
MHQYSYFSSKQVLIRIFQNVVILISVWSLLYYISRFSLVFIFAYFIEWDGCDFLAQSFIISCLTSDPKKRMSIKDALVHPWIVKHNK